MEAEVVLIVGFVLLGFGSLSMLIVRLCSPNLQGMGWLSLAFGTGAVGAGCLLFPGVPFVSVLMADMAVLGSLLLLHVAVSRVDRTVPVQFWHAGILIGLHGIVDLLRLLGIAPEGARCASFGVMVALLSAITGQLLLGLARKAARAPAIFSAVLLFTFGAFNLLRSATVLAAGPNEVLHERLVMVGAALFLAVALGLAFGFFWMTTAMLTAEVEHMASTDPLTRLYNRRVFLKWCEKELARSQRSGVPFSLLMVDLDHFKRINDSFGHHRGDEVLCATVERMQDSVRGIDVLCRWGGEEFAVLLPNASVEATRIVAERIRENIQRMRLAADTFHGEEEFEGLRLTVSIGAATYRDLDDDVPGMLLRADRALYRAKGAGRNRVLVAS